MKKFSIVTAYLKGSRGIGFNGSLPWGHVKEDMTHFSKLTRTTSSDGLVNSIIMGRKTFESIGSKPLKNRINIILTRNTSGNTSEGVTFGNKLLSGSSVVSNDAKIIFANSLDSALSINQVNDQRIEKKFVIGGDDVYKQAINHEQCDSLHVTELGESLNDKHDKYFPAIPEWFKLSGKSDIIASCGRDLSFMTYQNKLNRESQENVYLECLKDILDRGENINDRTGVGTKSLFSKNLTFKISLMNPDERDPTKFKYEIPAVTTKKLFFNGIIWELIWFLNGNTNAKWLQDRKVHIWDGNSSREYLDKVGLTDVPTGSIGLGYGYQWVNWNGQNINQIKNVIDTLKSNPESRRIVLSAWNVGQLDKMALPPCHMMYIFKVTNHRATVKTLNCQVILRSNDMLIGWPYNQMSTILLTILISRCVGMIPGSISLNITDAHIYNNHINQVTEQIKRTPYQSPNLMINKNINSYDDLCSLTKDDFTISDYHSWGALKAPMAV